MSYSLDFQSHVTLRVDYSYPASEQGGTGSTTVTEPINITVTVNDAEYNRSVKSCNGNLLGLNAAVKDSVIKQAAAKAAAANDISRSITSGFFQYTRSDFMQQMVQLENIVLAEGPKILTYLDQLGNIRTRMENDYNIIKRRYLEIFSKFDEELYRNIYELYSPCFILIDDCFDKLFIELNVPAIANTVCYADVLSVQNILITSYVKKNLMKTMRKLGNIVSRLRKLDVMLSRICEHKSIPSFETLYLPAVVMECDDIDAESRSASCFFNPEHYSEGNGKAASEVLKAFGDGRITADLANNDKDLIEIEFMKLVSGVSDERKRKELMILWDGFKARKDGER